MESLISKLFSVMRLLETAIEMIENLLTNIKWSSSLQVIKDL